MVLLTSLLPFSPTHQSWVEIKREFLPGQTATDRPDIVSRVFKLKVKNLQELVTKGQFFGPHRAFMYTTEWQKRGSPHMQMLLWLEQSISPNRSNILNEKKRQIISNSDYRKFILIWANDESTKNIITNFLIIKTDMQLGSCTITNK